MCSAMVVSQLDGEAQGPTAVSEAQSKKNNRLRGRNPLGNDVLRES